MEPKHLSLAVAGRVRPFFFTRGCALLAALLTLVFLVGCERTGAPHPQPTAHAGTTLAVERSAPPASSASSASPEGEQDGARPASTEGLPSGRKETVILAGGCFWGMEEILREVPGVLDTEVGYAGGSTASPAYDQVKTGSTGHAESVRVTFDPARLSFSSLLVDWFFKMHDPTSLNRQGNDVGTQYRSAIFFTTPAQQELAKKAKAQVDASGQWSEPVVTEIAPAGAFTPAEQYHQDYLQKNPGGYTCHYLRDMTF